MRAYQAIITTLLIAMVVYAVPAAAKGNSQPPRTSPYYEDHMGPDYGQMGPGMMGPGSGGMGRGYGMHGGGRNRPGRMGPGYQSWQSMPQADRERWRDMRANFLKETLPLRKKLNNIQMDLETEWSQSKPDMIKIRKLADQAADLRADLEKKRTRFLSQCRETFGDRGWSCPGRGF